MINQKIASLIHHCENQQFCSLHFLQTLITFRAPASEGDLRKKEITYCSEVHAVCSPERQDITTLPGLATTNPVMRRLVSGNRVELEVEVYSALQEEEEEDRENEEGDNEEGEREEINNSDRDDDDDDQ